MTVTVVTSEADVPDEMVDGKPTLVYWNIVGLAMPIRLALVHAGVDFADIRIEKGQPSSDNYDKAYPPAKAGKLSKILPFPNLPYFLDGDVKITQTNTILRHIARKYELVSPMEHMTDLCCDQLTDIEANIVRLAYGKGADAVFAWFKSGVPPILAKFSELLQASGTPFLTGSEPRVDDFKLYSFLYKMTVIQDELGNDETKGVVTDDLVAYMKRIEELPRVKEYIAGPAHLTKPLNNPTAKWLGA